MDPSLKKRKADENGAAILHPIDTTNTSIITTSSTTTNNSLTPTDLRKIIEPFTHEQLLDILQTAASRHLDVLESIRLIANRDPAQRKLFIRGLGWDTTTENLRTLFSAFGELEEAIVILDKTTGKSKGYGFITFKHIDGALMALKEPSKKIDGRMTVTQLAAAGVLGGQVGTIIGGVSGDVSSRKIYVGNVPLEMPADRLLAHFLSYGEIEEGPLGFDKQTGKSRGFALFVYKTGEAARASLVDPMKTIDGHQMNCKLAIDGKKKQPGGVVVPGQQTGEPVVAGVGDGAGMLQQQQQQSSMPTALTSQYAMPGAGVPGGGFPYGMYGSAHQAHAGMAHNQLTSSIGGATGLSSAASQVPSSLGVGGGYGAGLGNPYGGLGGGPGSAGAGLGNPYGGLGGGPGSAYAGIGGASASSMYRLPPGSVGLPSSGYPETGHYGLSSSAFPGHIHQPSASSPVPRVPPGGLYPTLPPYY